MVIGFRRVMWPELTRFGIIRAVLCLDTALLAYSTSELHKFFKVKEG